MKYVSISILLAALMIGGAIIYSQNNVGTNGSIANPSIADDLRFRTNTITKKMVISAVTAPDVQERLKKELRRYDIDTAKPLWIRATEDENAVVVAYLMTPSDGSQHEFLLSFKQDDFGRWVSNEINPPIYINK